MKKAGEKKNWLLVILAGILLGIFLFFGSGKVEENGDRELLHGIIIGIETIGPDSKMLSIEIIKGSIKGQKISYELNEELYLNRRSFGQGDKLLIEYRPEVKEFYVMDYVRSDILLWLFVIFVTVVLMITRFQGLGSLIGMGISFVILFKFTLPMILNGLDPILVAVLSSFLIIPVTFFAGHGVSRKTVVSVCATCLTLIFAGLSAAVFASLANLTGLSSEEVSFLQFETAEKLNFKGLLLAGMLIGILGILDDITISQASIVTQLKASRRDMPKKELYFRAMSIGKDHIASMVNTIVLIYAGSALPLLLLFASNSEALSEIINLEPVAEEIIRTLIGTISLILAVPITTLLAVAVLEAKDDDHKGGCSH